MVLFLHTQVRDASTGEFLEMLRGQEVTVCEVGTSSPLAITEWPSGVPVPDSVLRVTEQFAVPAFDTPDGVFTVDVVAANGARATLQSFEGGIIAAAAAQYAAETAQYAAEQAAQDAANVARPLWPLQGTPDTFPPIIGTGPDQAFPGNGNMDGRYYTKAEADAKYAPIGSTGGGDGFEGGNVRYELSPPGTYEPRGTARTDLQIVWIGTVPPPSATADSGVDFENTGTALNRGIGQGPDRWETVES